MPDEPREFALLCPHCGEENPPEFPVCWSCHGDLPGPTAAPMPIHELAPPTRTPAPDPRAQAARRRRIAFELAVALGVVWLPLCTGGILNSLDPVPPRDALALTWAFVTGAGPLMLVAYFAWLEGDWRRFLGLQSPRMADVLMGAATFVAMVVANALAYRLSLVLDLDQGGPFSHWLVEQQLLWIAPLDLLLWALVEEAFYRAYLWNRLCELSGRPALSIAVVAVLFSVSHWYPLGAGLAIFFHGLTLGWIFRVRRSLWPVVLGHWGYNLYVLALTQGQP